MCLCERQINVCLSVSHRDTDTLSLATKTKTLPHSSIHRSSIHQLDSRDHLEYQHIPDTHTHDQMFMAAGERAQQRIPGVPQCSVCVCV